MKKHKKAPKSEISQTAAVVDTAAVTNSSASKETSAEDGNRPVRVYCDGIYDLFHFGHARQLEQAKKLFPRVHLLVGVCNDALTHRLKGKTVMSDAERYESLRHCKWVDEVVEDAPWIITEDFLQKHRIDFVAHDDIPYADGSVNDVYASLKETGRFVATQRTEGISTSDLITRIVRNYDDFVRRNLKRGISASDLNVSFLKECGLRVEDSVAKLRSSISQTFKQSESSIRANWLQSKEEFLRLLVKWEQRSNGIVREFVQSFSGAQNGGDEKRKNVDENDSEHVSQEQQDSECAENELTIHDNSPNAEQESLPKRIKKSSSAILNSIFRFNDDE